MCNRIGFFVCFWVLSFGQLAAQVAGVTRSGENTVQDSVFLDQFGGEVAYPRLSRNGHILCYPPLVVLDSMRVTSENAARFYATVSFDGWSPVLARGFEYSDHADFSSSQQMAVAGAIGSFEAVVSGPLPNRDYYVRPYAVNAYGTSYGTVASFHTAVGPVVLDTLQANTLTPTSAGIAIEIADNGGAPLSGAVVAFSDANYQDTAAVGSLSNVTGRVAHVPLSGLAPSTDYYVMAVLSNGRFADTMFLRVHTPSDLTLTLVSSGNPTVSLCTGGNTLTYTAVLTGTDRHKPLYQYRWNASAEVVSENDSVLSVFYDTEGTYSVAVEAFYGPDTLNVTFLQTISPQAGTSSFYVCTNEFLNTADATTTNIASIRWLNGNRDIVATTKSVKLPTGYYTVECTDNFGCEFSKRVYVGKKKLSCIATDTVWANESAHFEDGVWRVDSVSDHEGNWYAVTQIGNQCWIRQNLRTRHTPLSNIDLVAQTTSEFKRMQYVAYSNTHNTFDPQTVAYYGAVYTWGAAMDTVVVPYSIFDFDRPVRGMCPKGWHIPSYEETWDMIEAVYYLSGTDEEPYPPLRVFCNYGGLNVPLREMLLFNCYDSYTNPAYPEEIYDASHLSLLRQPQTSIGCQFWVTNGTRRESLCYVLLCAGPIVGVTIQSERRQGAFAYVRCMRGNAE